jgi:uncharacterized protein HemY
MSFLFFLLFIVIVIALVVFLGAFNFIMTLLRGIFSLGNRSSHQHNEAPKQSRRSTKKSKVLFDKNEAEEVDYEEIK